MIGTKLNLMRMKTTSICFSVPVVIMSILSQLGIDTFSGILFFLVNPFIILFDPNLTFKWDFLVYLAILFTIYLLIGAIAGLLIKEWQVLILAWLFFTILLFVCGTFSFLFGTGSRFL